MVGGRTHVRGEHANSSQKERFELGTFLLKATVLNITSTSAVLFGGTTPLFKYSGFSLYNTPGLLVLVLHHMIAVLFSH